MQTPTGTLKLIRHVLGAEIYQDAAGAEWLALPSGELIPNK